MSNDTSSIYNDNNSVVIRNTSLGFTFPVRVPADIETFEAVFGSGTLLKLGITHCLYHMLNGQFREKLADGLVAFTGIEIPTKDGTEDGEPITEQKFLAYLLAKKKDDGTPVLTQAQANEIAMTAAAAVADLAPRESTRGEGKKTKEVIEKGTQIFNEIASGQRDLQDFVAKWEAVNTKVSFASLGDPSDVNTFVQAIHLNFVRAKAAAAAAAKAELEAI